jgi:hypothetical protein
MKFLGFIYLAGGCSLSILVLRAAHGVWADFWEIAMYSAIPNVLTVLLAVLLFRKPTQDATMDRVFLIACYLVGIGAGAYFYFT